MLNNFKKSFKKGHCFTFGRTFMEECERRYEPLHRISDDRQHHHIVVAAAAAPLLRTRRRLVLRQPVQSHRSQIRQRDRVGVHHERSRVRARSRGDLERRPARFWNVQQVVLPPRRRGLVLVVLLVVLLVLVLVLRLRYGRRRRRSERHQIG